jgi:hypothetical protein
VTITEKALLKALTTIVDPLSKKDLPISPAASLSYSSLLTLETLNLVTYGKFAVSCTREKPMVSCNTGWVGN